MSDEIERLLLEDLGFQRGTGDWDHEVWVYEGYCWLHFGDYDKQRWPSSSKHLNGNTLSRREVIQSLIEAIREEVWDSAQVRDFQY